MAKRQTAKIANSDILGSDKLYLQRARKVLPYLVRQAKARQTIYYSNLAKEVDIPNPRNLNYILGSIGNALIALSEQTKTDIPPIQCVVINKRQELPGEGIGWFISPTDFAKLNKTQRQKIVEVQLVKIYTFQYWDWVLEELGLERIKIDLKDELAKVKNFKGGGESEAHKIFKEYISNNPSVLGLTKIEKGQIEYILPSADKIDILFIDKELKIGVEVKSIISDAADILRGLFQCVKYKYLIEAEQTINDQHPNSRIILALQGQLPKELILVKNLLGVEVFESIK
jgi:hypothetical protein